MTDDCVSLMVSEKVRFNRTSMQGYFRPQYGKNVPHHGGAMETPILSVSDHKKIVGHRLRRALDALGVSQVAAAELMGGTKQSVNDWLAGRHYPAAYAVYRLHKLKGITYDWLFLGDWSQLPAWLADKLRPSFADMSAAQPEPDRLVVDSLAKR